MAEQLQHHQHLQLAHALGVAADDGDTHEYLATLLGMPLEEILRQPRVLETRQDRLQADIAEVCTRRHGAFINIRNATDQLSDTIAERMMPTLDKMHAGVDTVAKSCEAFQTFGQQMSSKQEELSLIREHEQQVSDILELPQLMEACERGELYEEAIEIRAQVRRLARRYSSNALLAKILVQVNASAQHMERQLIEKLSTDTKLHVCLRVIGYLRRLDSFTESELRLLFLLARNAQWMRMLNDLPQREPVLYLRRYIDISRDFFFDIVTQFRAIFSDAFTAAPTRANGLTTSPPPPTSKLASLRVAPANPFFSPQHPSLAQLSHATQAFLHDFIAAKLQDLIGTFTRLLPRIPEASAVASIHMQVVYYSTSLARIGLDFRPLVHDLFENAVLKLATDRIATATQDFVSQLPARSAALVAKTYRLPSPRPAPFVAGPIPSDPPTSSMFAPPLELINFPLLASLANAYLLASNDISLGSVPLGEDTAGGPSSALCAPLCQAINQSLQQVVGCLIDHYHHTYGTTTTPPGTPSAEPSPHSAVGGGRVRFEYACALLRDVLVPHTKLCVEQGIYRHLFRATQRPVDGIDADAVQVQLEPVLGAVVRAEDDSEPLVALGMGLLWKPDQPPHDDDEAVLKRAASIPLPTGDDVEVEHEQSR
ncbi:hypothetical protein RI367_002723 [Sorochytrium milnesiophthora]